MTAYERLDLLFQQNNGIVKTSQVFGKRHYQINILCLCQATWCGTGDTWNLCFIRCMDGCHVCAAPSLRAGGILPRERISFSEYRDKFILKGGLLVAVMVDLDAPFTMDVNAIIKGTTVGIEEEENMIASIVFR